MVYYWLCYITVSSKKDRTVFYQEYTFLLVGGVLCNIFTSTYCGTRACPKRPPKWPLSTMINLDQPSKSIKCQWIHFMFFSHRFQVPSRAPLDPRQVLSKLWNYREQAVGAGGRLVGEPKERKQFDGLDAGKMLCFFFF